MTEATLEPEERARILRDMQRLIESGRSAGGDVRRLRAEIDALMDGIERSWPAPLAPDRRRTLIRALARLVGEGARATAVRGGWPPRRGRPTPQRVERIPVLDQATSEECVLQVLLLRSHWRSRYAKAPFFTLGLASYLDYHVGGCAYRDQAVLRENNDLLMTYFSPVINRVVEALGDYVGQPARLAFEGAAIPGFHIYMPDPAFSLPVASVHQDYQYQAVFPEVTPEETISFTLAVSAPRGSGLNVWPEGQDSPVLHDYRPGEMIVHDGHCTHQAILGYDGETERITLQGHGITHDGELVLYW